MPSYFKKSFKVTYSLIAIHLEKGQRPKLVDNIDKTVLCSGCWLVSLPSKEYKMENQYIENPNST